MTTRSQILRLLRAGAGAQAWAQFRAGGWADRDDAEARLLRGRLVKDDAMRASGAERARLFLAAAEDYAAAAAQQRSTYALINAASLALLGGDRALAEARARAVLAMLDSGAHEPDTDYWLGATRAEAFLLLGQAAAACDGLRAAMAVAPRAWEEHSITLRQFALLLAALGEAAGWLDAFRPRPVLHFSGIIGVDAADRAAAERVAAAVARIDPSAGFGALAAGADILVAEALERVGADFHLVLPCAAEDFRAESVAPMGADWAARFDRLLPLAASLEVMAAPERLSQTAIDLADQFAMGMAIGQARMLTTAPVALRVTAEGQARQDGEGDRLWLAGGFGLESVAVRRSIETEALTGGVGEPWTALLAARGADVSHASMADAIAAAQALTADDETCAGLALRMSPEPRRGKALAAATGAAEVAARGSVAATRIAMAVALLHLPDLRADLIGEIRTAFGAEEIWRLHIPRPADASADQIL